MILAFLSGCAQSAAQSPAPPAQTLPHLAHWDHFEKQYCADSGKRRYIATLEDVPNATSWKSACQSTGAKIPNTNWEFPQPEDCEEQPRPRGVFYVPDDGCSQISEYNSGDHRDKAWRKDDYNKMNDGSVTCDAYCANMNHPEWGRRGMCLRAHIEKGMNAGSNIRCVDLGRKFGATKMSCYCRNPPLGFADTHNHQFANLAYGGKAVWGDAYGPIDQALASCAPEHGPMGISDLDGDISRYFQNGGLEFSHSTGGYPDFEGWPRFNQGVSHQSMYADWLHRAVRGGLRLMVVFAVNNKLLCTAAHHLPGRTCSDAEAIALQVQAARAMQEYIDNQEGGAGRGWYRIVDTPELARSVIEQHKLAVVLGIEVDHLLTCPGDNQDCTPIIRSTIAYYRSLGVRHIIPIHFYNNSFGGQALMFPVVTPGRCEDCSDKGFVAACNVRGLRNNGKIMIQEMIRQKMIIDIDHMSDKSKGDALAIMQQEHYPPISSHTGFLVVAKGSKRNEGQIRPEQIEAIRRLGGMVNANTSPYQLRSDVEPWESVDLPRVQLQCGGSSQVLAQNYLYLLDHTNKEAGIGLGTDFNVQVQPGPRFGLNPCMGDGPEHPQVARVPYPFPISVEGSDSELSESYADEHTRAGKLNFNEEGLADIGLLPDLIEDLKQQGVRPEDLEPLFDSAIGYVNLWEKIDPPTAKAAPPTTPPK
jgi:microsomal dipeptidase-like Zn-dependent dipeptidase